jgi:MFS family permease
MLQAIRVPGFARLLSTYTLNDFAHLLATLALSILVYDQTKDAFATTGLFLAAEFLPGLVVPALVARVDGLRPGRVLATAYTLEALVLGGAALLTGAFWLPLILVLAFANGALATMSRAITRAATVSVLEPAGALREGNAAMNLGFSVNSATGPAAAGAIVALLATGPALAVAAGAFAILAALVAPARIEVRREHGDEHDLGWKARLGAAVAYVRASPELRRLLGGQGLALLLLTMAIPIQVIYAKETLDAGNAGFGVFAASWGLGMVLGSVLYARERRRPAVQLILWSTAVTGLGYVGIAVAPTLAVACAVSVLGGLGNGLQWVAVMTAVQEATDERFQARVAGLFEALATVAPGAGFLLGGLITALLGPRAAYGLAGAGVLLLVAIGKAALGRRAVAPGHAPGASPAATAGAPTEPAPVSA